MRTFFRSKAWKHQHEAMKLLRGLWL